MLSSPIQRKEIQFNPTEHKEREAGEARIQASLPTIDYQTARNQKSEGDDKTKGGMMTKRECVSAGGWKHRSGRGCEEMEMGCGAARGESEVTAADWNVCVRLDSWVRRERRMSGV